RKPALITLQETCRDWDERLQDRLPGYTVVFGPVRNLAVRRGTPARCHHPTDFGNTIIFRDGLGFGKKTAESHQLGSTLGDEYREMICVRSESRKLAACSAHLTPGVGKLLESRRKEAAEAQRVLASRYKDYTVILGGDINDLPLSGVLGGFYHRDYRHGAHGVRKEAGSPCGDTMKPERRTDGLPRNRYTQCRSGQPTHSKGKIDYIFVSPSVHVKWSGVSYSEQSDHKQLWTRVVL
ncbi:MAG TPA: endonuclease/exonuclease/phosphatase family protein, partial [Streptomyces sp.]|nr:endonuclease/exonuclease/phosphatase family protein [Streptomyces sp.]